MIKFISRLLQYALLFLFVALSVKMSKRKRFGMEEKFAVIMELDKDSQQKDVCAKFSLSVSTVVTIYVR